MIPPQTEDQTSIKTPLIRALGWIAVALVGGVLSFSAFTILTGMEESLIGIPVGLAIGQIMFYASGRRGGRWFQILAVALTYLAFSLTYGPGMFEIALRRGFSIPAFVFAIFITLASPVIDAHNGLLGQFMVLAGMCLAWTLARSRKKFGVGG